MTHGGCQPGRRPAGRWPADWLPTTTEPARGSLDTGRWMEALMRGAWALLRRLRRGRGRDCRRREPGPRLIRSTINRPGVASPPPPGPFHVHRQPVSAHPSNIQVAYSDCPAGGQVRRRYLRGSSWYCEREGPGGATDAHWTRLSRCPAHAAVALVHRHGALRPWCRRTGGGSLSDEGR